MDPGQGRTLAELTKEQDPPASGHHMLKAHSCNIFEDDPSSCISADGMQPLSRRRAPDKLSSCRMTSSSVICCGRWMQRVAHLAGRVGSAA